MRSAVWLQVIKTFLGLVYMRIYASKQALNEADFYLLP